MKVSPDGSHPSHPLRPHLKGRCKEHKGTRYEGGRAQDVRVQGSPGCEGCIGTRGAKGVRAQGVQRHKV